MNRLRIWKSICNFSAQLCDIYSCTISSRECRSPVVIWHTHPLQPERSLRMKSALTSGNPHTVTDAFIFNQVQFHPGQHNHTQHTPPEKATEDWITLLAESWNRSLFWNSVPHIRFTHVPYAEIKSVCTVKYSLVYSCPINNTAERWTSLPTDSWEQQNVMNQSTVFHC